MGFIPDDYETVAERLKRWWTAYPNGCILTSMVHYDSKTVVFRAEGYADANSQQPIASGYAEEVLGSSPVNKTSFVENCETSSIGRMISNSPIGVNGERPSREEMQKVARVGKVVGSGGPTSHGAFSTLASQPQKTLINTLREQVGMTPLTDQQMENLTKSSAMEIIDDLKAQAKAKASKS